MALVWPLGKLSANGQVCVSVLLMVCEVSEIGAFSLCVGVWSHYDNGGLWESTHQLMFHEFGSFMVIKSPGLESPTLGVQA